MTSYADKARAHLSNYRRTQMEVNECGRWSKKPYCHSLPEKLRWLNLFNLIVFEVGRRFVYGCCLIVLRLLRWTRKGRRIIPDRTARMRFTQC